MTVSLVRAQRVIEGRFRLLEQKLNDELGFRDQRLRFAKLNNRSGPTIWGLRNMNAAVAGLPVGSVAELAAAGNDESILYFGYNEEWQPARGREQIEFVSSNLRFVISGVEDMPDLRFRLEWAGAKTEGGAISYPGVGAAQPHWQLDIDAGWIDALEPELAQAEVVTIEVELEPAVEEVNLDGEAGDGGAEPNPLPRPRKISPTLAGFHHLHLPARSMWHDMLCVMPELAGPQQHTPSTEEEIDNWVVSALRYLRSEFQNYL